MKKVSKLLFLYVTNDGAYARDKFGQECSSTLKILKANKTITTLDELRTQLVNVITK